MVVEHPVWCDETECAVQADGLGTHVSRRVWIKGRGQGNTAVFIEESTDSGGPWIVATSIRGGREGASVRWPVENVPEVLAAVGQLARHIDAGPPVNGGRP